MADKFVSQANLSLFSQLLKGKYAVKVGIAGRVITLYSADGTSLGTITVPETEIADVSASGTASGLMTPEQAAKLDGITASADSVSYVSNGVLRINGTNTTVYAPSGKTQSSALVKVTTANGLVTGTTAVTKGDITDLGIPESATVVSASNTNGHITVDGADVEVYSHPTSGTALTTASLVKIKTDSTGHISGTTAVSKSDITALGIPSENTTYSAVSTSGSTNGLMTPAQATKLAGIATGAEVNTITSVKMNGAALTISGRAVNIDLSDYAKKSDLVDMKVLQYKGSVATFSALPSSPEAGDVYNIEAADDDAGIGAGSNVVYTGSDWDVLNPSLFSISECTDAEITALV